MNNEKFPSTPRTSSTDGFAIALNIFTINLENEDDLMLTLDVTDQEGREIWKKVKRDKGIRIFEQLSKDDPAQSSQLATQYADVSAHIIER